MAEGLQIQIGANVTSAVQGLNQVQAELDQTAKDATVLGNSVEKASAKIRTLPNVTGQATSTLTNFSRIVQDAPFGIIGIANNIDPLVQSFNSLKSTTGSATSAFKALIGQLAGPAGLALGISVVTSLLVTYSDKLFGSGQAAKKAKSDFEEFNKSLDNTKSSALSTGIQLQQFVDLAKNERVPLEQRNEALKQANEILGKYGEKLTFANIATQAAIDLVDKYREGVIAKALAEAYADRIAQKTVEQVKTKKELTAAQVAFNKAEKESIQRQQSLRGVTGGSMFGVNATDLGRGGVFASNYATALTRLKKAKEDDAAITAELTDLTKALNVETLKSLSLAQQPPPPGPAKEFDFTPILGISKLTEQLAKEADQFEIGIVTKAYENRIKEGFKKLKPIKLDIEFDPNIQNVNEQFEKLKEPLLLFNKFIDSFNQQIGDAVGGLFESFAEGLGGQNIGQKITAVFSNLLNAVGKALIQYGIVKEGLDKILGPAGFAIPGAVAIGLGIAAIAASTLLKNFGGARADGGPVSGNTPYLVGERGPELFVPATSGKIIPNNEVSSFGGGLAAMLGGSGRGGTTLRGQDIILAYARAQRSQLRVNG
jgi:hypothetical protein